jgi:hypothetical protein
MSVFVPTVIRHILVSSFLLSVLRRSEVITPFCSGVRDLHSVLTGYVLLRVGSRICNQNRFVSEVSIDAAVKTDNSTVVVISNAHTHRIEVW